MRSLCKKIGINYDIMKLIVKNKIKMDNRRGEKGKNIILSSLIVYFFIGFMSSFIIGMDMNIIVKMSLYFSFLMIMLLSIFISDFSSVILDINDKDILLTKGVDNKTLNASKIVHIFIYMGMLSLAIGAGGIFISLKYGIKFTLMLVGSIFFIDILMIFITTIMYIIIFKFFEGEKLKDMINIFQIGVMLIFIIGYQLIGNSINLVDLQIVYEPKIWNIIIPPMWFAATFGIIEGIDSNILKIMSVLSLVLPLLFMLIYIKSTTLFEHNLEKLNDNSYKATDKKSKVYEKISRLVCKEKEEKVFFDFIYNIISKDREFKTKLYPSLATAILIPFLMMLTAYENQGIKQYIYELKEAKMYLSIYLCVLISQNIITFIKHSNEYESAWIYEILPIKNKKNIYSAMIKAGIYKLILPIFIFIGIIFGLIFGIDILVDVIIVFLSCIISILFVHSISDKKLPFSCDYKNVNSSSGVISMIKSMLLVGILAVIHFICSINIFIKIMYLFILIIFIKLVWNKIFK